MKNSNLKEIFKEYSEFVPKELQSEINNSNAVALLGMYISFSISNHSNKVTVTNDQIKKTFNWESNQVQRANSKLEVMKLISREVSTKRGVPSIVTLLFKEESQQKEMRQEEQQAIEKRNTPMPPANDKDSSMMELILQEIESLKEEISTLREENKNLKEELSILKEEDSKSKEGMRILNKNFKNLKQEFSTLCDSNKNASKTSGNAPRTEENTSKVHFPFRTAGTLSERFEMTNSKVETRNITSVDENILRGWFDTYKEGIYTLPQSFNRPVMDKNIKETASKYNLNFSEFVSLTVTVYQDRLRDGNIISNPNKYINVANSTFSCNMWKELNLDKKSRTYMKLYNETVRSHNAIVKQKIEYEENPVFDEMISSNFSKAI